MPYQRKYKDSGEPIHSSPVPHSSAPYVAVQTAHHAMVSPVPRGARPTAEQQTHQELITASSNPDGMGMTYFEKLDLLEDLDHHVTWMSSLNAYAKKSWEEKGKGDRGAYDAQNRALTVAQTARDKLMRDLYPGGKQEGARLPTDKEYSNDPFPGKLAHAASQ